MNVRWFFRGLNEHLGDTRELQNRISEAYVFLLSISMLFFGMVDVVLGLSHVAALGKMLTAVPFFIGYLVMLRKGHHQLILQGTIGLGLVTVCINYFANDGYQGPTLYTIFFFAAVISILITGKKVFFWLAFTFLVYFSLFFGEIQGYFVIEEHYSDLNDLFFDHFITILISCIFFLIGISFLLRSYRIKNQALLKIQKEKDEALIELDQLNVKKNQLIALLSHDLKNPVSTLQTTLELVDKEMIGYEESGFILKNLKEQSFHLNKILDNTLNWVNAEMGDKKANRERVSILKFTREVVAMMVGQAMRKNQRILLEIEGEDFEFDLEVNEVQIILKNLLDNAIKFSPISSSIELSLTMEAGDIRWEVFNPGEPISDHLHQNLFEFNVKSSLGTSQEKGTGMGLHLCKKIADQIGYGLGFDTWSKSGNRFYLERNSLVLQ